MRNLESALSLDHFLKFYHAEIHSRISYGIVVWGNTPAAHSVFLCQKRILRCLVGCPPDHSCRNIYKEHKILTVSGICTLSSKYLKKEL